MANVKKMERIGEGRQGSMEARSPSSSLSNVKEDACKSLDFQNRDFRSYKKKIEEKMEGSRG